MNAHQHTMQFKWWRVWFESDGDGSNEASVSDGNGGVWELAAIMGTEYDEAGACAQT